VFSSTCAVYGEPDEVPIGETALTRPSNPDGASKLAVDRTIGDFCGAHGLGAVSLRYFNVAGASWLPTLGLSPRLTRVGTQVRSASSDSAAASTWVGPGVASITLIRSGSAFASSA
jgi:UDP-glucose 4-epimerase